MDDITKINSTKRILILTIPIFIELILQLVIGYADQIMINNYDENAVSAISNANSIINLLLIFFSVLSTASVILISQYKGLGDKKSEETIYSIAFFLNLSISIIFGIVLFFLAPLIFKLMNVKEELYDNALTYIRITGGLIVLPSILSTFCAYLRSNALMKEVMIISFIINIINIFFNWLLIYGIWIFPEMGVAGVAWSSNLSRAIGIIIAVVIFMKKVGVGIHLKCLFPFPKKIFLKILKIGIPSSGENFSYSMSQIVILGYVNTFPLYVINTRSYSNILVNISYLFAAAVASALVIAVGRLVGARQLDDCDRRVKDTLKIALVISTICSILLFIFVEPLFSIFTKDPEIIALGRKIMFIEIFLEIGRCLNIVLVRSLQAAGDINYPIILSIIFCWIVAVLGGYILGVICNMGLVGIWISMAIDECARGIIFVFRWNHGKWRGKSLVEKPAIE